MKAPGVYLNEIFQQPEVILRTGILGFVGLSTAKEFQDKFYPLNRKEDLDNSPVQEDSFLKQSIIGFFANGGTRCYVVLVDPTGDVENALTKAFAPLDDVDLVAVPDAVNDAVNQRYGDVRIKVQQAVLKHCSNQGNRFAILDVKTVDGIKEELESIKQGLDDYVLRNVALYYPWLKNTQGRWVPPCGHIAGIFARSDRARGVFKAPANEEIHDAVNLQVLIDNSDQGEFNSQGINCLRAFPGKGIRIWGARTLSSDINWRYINVQRLFITIKRWIDLNMSWAVFEPNTPQLWVRIQRELDAYLTQLWRSGAFKGKTPKEAFYVKCNAETNPSESRERGNVVTEIGFAPASPAEFIIVQITHRANTTEQS